VKRFVSRYRQGVDFTNVFARIFRARFSYVRLFSSYVLRKTRAKNVGEIDPRTAVADPIKLFSFAIKESQKYNVVLNCLTRLPKRHLRSCLNLTLIEVTSQNIIHY